MAISGIKNYPPHLEHLHQLSFILMPLFMHHIPISCHYWQQKKHLDLLVDFFSFPIPILEDPPANINDIGYLCNKTAPLTDDQRYEFCCNVWRPDAKFFFPESILYGKERKFSFSWLQDYKWLQYFTVLDGAFCLSCMLFGCQIGVNPCKVVKLVGSLFKGWSCAVTTILAKCSGTLCIFLIWTKHSSLSSP